MSRMNRITPEKLDNDITLMAEAMSKLTDKLDHNIRVLNARVAAMANQFNRKLEVQGTSTIIEIKEVIDEFNRKLEVQGTSTIIEIKEVIDEFNRKLKVLERRINQLEDKGAE